MNKARRHELKMLHYKRRLRIYGAKSRSIKQYLNGNSINVNCNALRTTGKPCSCAGCSPYKYDRAKEKEKARRLADPISEAVIRSTAIVRQSPFIPEIEGCD
jgi:hypothetical protein